MNKNSKSDRKTFVIVGLIFIAVGAYGLVKYPDYVGAGWVAILSGSGIISYIAITGRT